MKTTSSEATYMTASELQDNIGVMIDSTEEVDSVLPTETLRSLVESESTSVNELTPQMSQPGPEYRRVYAGLAYDVAQAVQGYLQQKKSLVQSLEQQG